VRFRRCRGLGCGGVDRVLRQAAGAEVGDRSVVQILGREIV
jgi:hypothetical protein